ncbi:phage tail protein [Pseudomonas sp. GXZC]|uniref:phage tail protein n=1 Tax=Pseudomonas sp. GXZC TaxID=3003351 RepID=UPI0022AAC917|nr:phage tail protein [Pseudomonas sp. GXZC]WAT31825.1 phage tail protein [Pseudomonas sp. GXZC]
MANVLRPLSPGVFAADAQTSVPANPVPGVSYRDAANGTKNIELGWPFQRLVNSAEFNEVMYRVTALLDVLGRTAGLAWSDAIDYHGPGPGQAPCFVASTDGHLYVALQASGPTQGGARDPHGGSHAAYWRQFSGLAVGPDVGDIKVVATPEPPHGWLKCNGAVVSRTQYAKLFEVIGTRFGAGNGSTTFGLPDLRGEFVRGWDDGRGVDTGRALGSAQGGQNASHSHGVTVSAVGDHQHAVTGSTDTVGSHVHSVSGSTNTTGEHYHYSSASGWVNNGGNATGGAGVAYGNPGSNTAGAHAHSITGQAAAAGSHAHAVSGTAAAGGGHGHTATAEASGGTEARPRNVALLYVIKY